MRSGNTGRRMRKRGTPGRRGGGRRSGRFLSSILITAAGAAIQDLMLPDSKIKKLFFRVLGKHELIGKKDNAQVLDAEYELVDEEKTTKADQPLKINQQQDSNCINISKEAVNK